MCYGLPIRPAFNLPAKPKPELRQQLGMDETASTVMLVGGGEGMGKLEATAEALAQTCVTSHIFLSFQYSHAHTYHDHHFLCVR